MKFIEKPPTPGLQLLALYQVSILKNYVLFDEDKDFLESIIYDWKSKILASISIFVI